MPNRRSSLGRHVAAPVALHVGDQQHVGAVGIELEIVGDVLAQDRGREGAEALAVLDLEIEPLLHLGIARIAEDRAGAERARPELHAALEPADGMARFQRVAGALDRVLARRRPW